MTKRQLVIEGIRIEGALHGMETRRSILLYVENRISHAVYMDALTRGVRQFERNKEAKEAQHAG